MTESVAEICARRKLSMDQLTTLSGLDDGRVLAITMGRWTPSPQERRKIADALEVQIDEITWGHKTPIQHLYGHGPG